MTGTVYFFDSSALVKRYVLEAGTAWVQSATHPEAERLTAIAEITIAEVAAALASKLRSRLITTEQFDAAVNVVIRDSAEHFMVVPIDQRVVQRAVQLACGLVLNEALVAAEEPALTFVTADQNLLAAAQAEGVPVEDPNGHRSPPGSE